MGPEWILVLFISLLIAVAFIYVLMTVVPVMPFLYANAVVQSRTRKLIPDSKMQNLIDCKTTKTFVDGLQDTDYNNNLKDKETVAEIHEALENSFLDTVDELYSFSPTKIMPLFDAYLMFYEAKVLKSVYKKKILPESNLDSFIQPIGTLSPRLVE